MIIPIRCFTCNKLLADKWTYYKNKVEEYKKTHIEKKDDSIYDDLFDKPTIEKEVLNELGLTKMCCVRHMLTHRDIIDEM